MTITKSPNPLWTFIDKYVLKDSGQEHVHHIKLFNGTVRVFSKSVEIERIVPGNPNMQHITR